jgi:hypothetical protein
MSSGAVSFKQAIPFVMVNNIQTALTFYEQIGFQTGYQDPSFAVIARDEVQLHLGQSDISPAENPSSCRIVVANIETFYQQCPPHAIHPNGPLTTKPWGFKEFAILDSSGVCITFAEPVQR